jgi:hypothetical protein
MQLSAFVGAERLVEVTVHKVLRLPKCVPLTLACSLPTTGPHLGTGTWQVSRPFTPAFCKQEAHDMP